MDKGKYNFCITIDSKKVATFLEISDNDLMMEPIEYRQGYRDLNSAVKRQVLTKYTNITFKIGVIYDIDFLHWIIDSTKELVDRKTITFCLYDTMLQSNVEWEIMNAWPVKYEGIDFKDDTTDRTIRMIELAHEGIKRL